MMKSSSSTVLFALAFLLLCSVPGKVRAQQLSQSSFSFPVDEIVKVRYGYFPEPRPLHVACARGWLDLYDVPSRTYYQVSCHPQTSGRFAASRLDSGQLHLAHLGSTPMAEALARRLDLLILYITQYAGDSQGIYARPNSTISHPLDLVGMRIGVPFGSTMHYQVLFLLDLLGLKGRVQVLDLSPGEIIHAWDEGSIDAGACWGSARDYLLKHGGAGNPALEPAKPLISSKVLSDWGRPTFTVLAADRTFANNHQRFVTYITGVLSRLNDSYLDRLGLINPKNVERWGATKTMSDGSVSYVASMVDAMMIGGEVAGSPSELQLFTQREALDAFVQPNVTEQVSCSHFGTSKHYTGSIMENLDDSSALCKETLSPIRKALKQTTEFLFDQKIIADLPENFEDSVNGDGVFQEDRLDGIHLAWSYDTCSGVEATQCLPAGKYAQYGVKVGSGSVQNQFELLDKLEEMDNERAATPYATPNEIGRASATSAVKDGSSTCQDWWNATVFTNGDAVSGKIGEAGYPGTTYSDNLNCWLTIQAIDCSEDTYPCETFVRVELDQMRVWSGDFLRVFADPYNKLCDKDSPTKVLLAQWSGLYDEETSGATLLNLFPPIVARSCLLIQFETDGNSERSYGDVDNKGDGFELTYDRNYAGCLDSSHCNGFPCEEGLCECDGIHWGADCSFVDYCLGTQKIQLIPGQSLMIESSSKSFQADGNFRKSYPNDLDCSWELELVNPSNDGSAKRLAKVELRYDLEATHDLLWLNSGPVASTPMSDSTYAVVTGTSTQEPEIYFLPFDENGIAHLRLRTDAMGRRGGFVAYIEVIVENHPFECTEPGVSGELCEINHCVVDNNFITPSESTNTLNQDMVIGRIVSQVPSLPVNAMPSTECGWTLPDSSLSNAEALRLAFQFPLSLEPHRANAGGDELVIHVWDTDNNVDEFTHIYVEECGSDAACNHWWQTGVCFNRTCEVKTTFDIELPAATLPSAKVIFKTDRNDGDVEYSGFDLDLLLVQECPSNEAQDHCEAGTDNQCVDGHCICSGGVPCNCPCEGNPPLISTQVGILIAVLVPICVVFIGVFFWYRRRKNRRSREQKAVIAAKEAELDAFRDSVVGMRTATTEYIPVVAKNDIQQLKASGVLSVQKGDVKDMLNSPSTPTWCWQETSHLMDNHDSNDIVGDPSECFVKYDKASNDILEKAYQAQNGRGTCIPRRGYTVSFDAMIQTKDTTGFQRDIKRVVEGGLGSLSMSGGHVPKADTDDDQSSTVEIDMSECQYGEDLPDDLKGEPQMVLIRGDIVQINTTRNDGWAFGSKIFHSNEVAARELVKLATAGLKEEEDQEILTDNGWFKMDATHIPSGEELALLKANVGDTGALEPPENWEPVADPTVVQLHCLSPGQEEYQAVKKAFMSTLRPPSFDKKVKIISIRRVQNLAMYQGYIVKRQTICYRETGVQGGDISSTNAEAVQKRAVARFERRWLWHGTNIEVMDKILQQGFNRSFCGKNATAYGKGVYFARDASYSAYPIYAIPDKDGNQYMLACRVVVGEYCRGTSDALTPDVRDPTTHTLYDTTVGLLSGDTMSNPSIYVTYHDAQAYPEYAIQFRLK